MEELTVQVSQVPWEAATGYCPGTERKVLRRGADDEPKTVLLRLPPGFEMGTHSHVSVEHHYVLEGEYESKGAAFPAGSYQVIPSGTTHGPFRSATGALLLVIWAD